MEKRKFYLKQTNDELQKILANKDERKKVKVIQDQIQKINLQRKVEKIKKMIGEQQIPDEDSPEET